MQGPKEKYNAKRVKVKRKKKMELMFLNIYKNIIQYG